MSRRDSYVHILRRSSSIAKSEFWQSFGVVSLLLSLRPFTLNSDRDSTLFGAQLRGNNRDVLQRGFQQTGPPESNGRAEVQPGAQSKETN